MIRLTLKQLRTFFNLNQWIMRWFNLSTPQSMPVENSQACQSISQPANPPLAHSYMPLLASVIPWCQLSSQLAQMPVKAWGFVYMDAATNQPIGMQAVLAKDMPALFDAASDTALQDGWRALKWVDVMPDAVEPEEYENALLAAMQRRRQYLHDQMTFLDGQIAAHAQSKSVPPD